MSQDESQLAERVRALATDVASGLEVEILDVVVKGSPGRRLVRLVADVADLTSPDGVDIDTIATLSRRLGDALDEQDTIAGSYTLEVTSPGADRPLRTPRDFVRNLGREVRVVRDEAVEGDREARGTLVAADEDAVTLEAAGEQVRIELTEVDHGAVVLPW